MRRQATVVSQGSDATVFRLTWRPTAQERRNNPQLPPGAELNVFLHEIRVHANLTLFLATNLADPSAPLAELSLHRGDVEIDIRNIKVVLDAEHLRARSVEMFQKELLTSLVAYNLVTQFRRQAAAAADVPPRRLSFKRNWSTFRIFLWEKTFFSPEEWRRQYDWALSVAQKEILPNRPGRSYEREAYHRRHKSTSHKKRRPKPEKTSPET